MTETVIEPPQVVAKGPTCQVKRSADRRHMVITFKLKSGQVAYCSTDVQVGEADADIVMQKLGPGYTIVAS